MEESQDWGEKKLEGDRRTVAWGLGSLVGWKGENFLEFLRFWEGKPERWFQNRDPLKGTENPTRKVAARLRELHQVGREDLCERVKSWPGQGILFGEPEYPQRLVGMKMAPAVLHIQGDPGLVKRPGVAVVGSRKIGVRAAKMATTILEGLVRRGTILVSGGALGADGVAHEVSVREGQPTLVVLPSGLGRVTPRGHERLFEQILDTGGALLSEYPPFESVRKYHFRRRNEVIAALSCGVFVLRAEKESGTMLTVRAAQRLGRPLAAMPGEPGDPLSVGCHQILQEGGRLIASSDDLLRWWTQVDKGPEWGSENGNEKRVKPKPAPVCPILRRAQQLSEPDGGFSLEALIRATGQSAAEVQAVLLHHELAGIVKRVAGGERFELTW